MKKKIMIDDARQLARQSQKNQMIESLNGKKIADLKNTELLHLTEWMAILLGLVDENGKLSVN